jgi:hypothetical protein
MHLLDSDALCSECHGLVIDAEWRNRFLHVPPSYFTSYYFLIRRKRQKKSLPFFKELDYLKTETHVLRVRFLYRVMYLKTEINGINIVSGSIVTLELENNDTKFINLLKNGGCYMKCLL